MPTMHVHHGIVSPPRTSRVQPGPGKSGWCVSAMDAHQLPQKPACKRIEGGGEQGWALGLGRIIPASPLRKPLLDTLTLLPVEDALLRQGRGVVSSL